MFASPRSLAARIGHFRMVVKAAVAKPSPEIGQARLAPIPAGLTPFFSNTRNLFFFADTCIFGSEKYTQMVKTDQSEVDLCPFLFKVDLCGAAVKQKR